MARLSRAVRRALQRALNRFTSKYLVDVEPLREDGDVGAATRKRIRLVKFYLGYVKARRDAAAGHELRSRMWRPRRRSAYQDAAAVRRGLQRRRKQRKLARKARREANRLSAHGGGIVNFDGKPVVEWIAHDLQKLRSRGWKGTIASGYRTPEYSEHLCEGICGAPSCPGRCAGRSSNHTRKGDGEGAVDLTFYAQALEIIREHPGDFRLRGGALPNDPMHFSADGH